MENLETNLERKEPLALRLEHQKIAMNLKKIAKILYEDLVKRLMAAPTEADTIALAKTIFNKRTCIEKVIAYLEGTDIDVLKWIEVVIDYVTEVDLLNEAEFKERIKTVEGESELHDLWDKCYDFSLDCAGVKGGLAEIMIQIGSEHQQNSDDNNEK